MLKTPEEITTFINFHKEFIDSNKEKALTSDKELKSRWLWGFGTNAYAAALGYLMLNKRCDALIWFNKSAGFYFQCIELYDETNLYFGVSKSFTETSALQAMKSMILSGNKNFINEIACYIIKNKPEISMSSDLVYNYVLAISMVITENKGLNKDLNEQINEQLNKLSESEEKYGKMITGYYVGTAEALEGIAENNREKILNGVNKMLFSFTKYLSGTKDVPLCTDAMMVLLTAKNKEVMTGIEDINKNYQRYVPLCLFE